MDHDISARQRTVDAAYRFGGPDHFRLILLGGFRLTYRDNIITLPPGAQRLLSFLALHMHPLLRTYVAGTLWPDSTQARSFACLRSALWRLRRPGLRIVEATSEHLRLSTALEVDTHTVATTVHRLLDPAASCSLEDLDPAPLCGELLPDWNSDDWILVERERLRQLCLHGLEAMCERLAALRRYGEAIEAGLAAVRSEPLRESAHRVLISVHLAEGNSSEAFRQYRWYERILREELGLTPSSQITRLISESDHPAQPSVLERPLAHGSVTAG
jgi:DNA-binding SARP family transcriptional activator